MENIKNPKVSSKDRKSLLFYIRWINRTLGIDVKSITELKTGVIYLKLLKLVLPKYVTIKLMNSEPKTEREYRANLQLLQRELNYLEIKVYVPISQLTSKNNVEANYNLIHWMHEFFIANSVQEELPVNKVPPKTRKDYIKMVATNIMSASDESLKECENMIKKGLKEIHTEYLHTATTHARFQSIKAIFLKAELVLDAINNTKDEVDYYKNSIELFKLIVEAGNEAYYVSFHINDLEIRKKSDEILESANRIMFHAGQCIRTTARNVKLIQIKPGKPSKNVKSDNEILEEHFKAVVDCIEKAKKYANIDRKSTDPEDRRRADMEMWSNLYEGRIRCKKLLAYMKTAKKDFKKKLKKITKK